MTSAPGLKKSTFFEPFLRLKMADRPVLGLDNPEEGDVTLRTNDGTEITIPAECRAQSEFLQALVFENEERVLVVPNIPSIYLDVAAQYLRATCHGYTFEEAMNEEQLALVTVRNVVYYPELLRYLYGYLGISSFRDFYQRMLLAAIDAGTVNANIAKNLEGRSLDLLTEAQLYEVAQYEPQRINTLYRVPNARSYLQLKLQRDTLVLSGAAVLEVRKGELWANGSKVPTPEHVQSVHSRVDITTAVPILRSPEIVRRYYYYLSAGQIYEGKVQPDGTLIPARLFDTRGERLISLSVGRRWLTGITEDGGVFLADAGPFPAFPPWILNIKDVREVLSSPNAERLVVLLSGGRIALYGSNQFTIPSPLQALVATAPPGRNITPRELPTVTPIRMVASDEALLLTEELSALTTTNEIIPNVLSLGFREVTFNVRLEARRKGQVLERGVTAMGYDSYTQRGVFRATNGALRYWRMPSQGQWVREYQRQR